MKYKVGDRIFYKTIDGEVETDIVVEIRNEFYYDNNKRIDYQWLIMYNDGNCSSGIEDYNCISPNSRECKELNKIYRRFDRHRESVIGSIMEILNKWEKPLQKEILKIIEMQIQ